VGYYIVGQLSKFVPSGSIRIASTQPADLATAAFLTPAGKKVLVVLNESASSNTFNIRFKNRWVKTTLQPQSAGTFIW
jgi:glucosylceramidase